MNLFFILFLYFMIYSIIGWCFEMLYCRIIDGKFSSRGFLYGPYCPIYGFGGVIVLVCLEPLSNHMFLVFLLAMVLTSLLEYFTSFLMEKLFDAKWWDYSRLPFNINGRVCLLNSVLFGILGLMITYLFHPYIKNFVNLIPPIYIPFIAYFFILILVIDFTITLNSLINFKEKLKEIHVLGETLKEKASTKQLNADFKNKMEEIRQRFIEMKLSSSTKRLIKAFPNLKFYKFNSTFEDLKKNFIKQAEQKKKVEKK